MLKNLLRLIVSSLPCSQRNMTTPQLNFCLTFNEVFVLSVCCCSFKLNILNLTAVLKGSCDIAKKNIIMCIWCNAMCLWGLRLKKNIIFHKLYIIIAPLCSAFLKRVAFYKAHCSEKLGVL